jgi:hypothetical protein
MSELSMSEVDRFVPQEPRCGHHRPFATELPRQPVSTGYGVGVDVQGGRSSGVTEARRHDRNGGAGVEHLGGREVAQVVESEVTEPGRASHLAQALGHEVRRPWLSWSIVSENDRRSRSITQSCSQQRLRPRRIERERRGRLHSDAQECISIRHEPGSMTNRRRGPA